MAERGELEVVPEVEAGSPDHCDRAEARIQRALADDVGDPLVAPEQRDLVDEMPEQHVEVGVRTALRRAEPATVTQHSPVRVDAVLAGVAEHITAVELI